MPHQPPRSEALPGQDSDLPLVYACSGASSAAQMANYLAVRLDRLRVAEMSCIAGVGGDVKPLVRTAKSGRSIIALDGCPLHCTARILQRQGLTADRHYDLSTLQVEKRRHADFDPEEAARVLQHVLTDPARPRNCAATAPDEDSLCESCSPPCYLAEFQPSPLAGGTEGGETGTSQVNR
jgi:uncharacterized metal-binding protein